MKKIFITTFYLSFSMSLLYGDNNTEVEIKKITSGQAIASINEWYNDGENAPIVAFDGKLNTCVTENSQNNKIQFMIVFSKQISIDEIRIMNGYGFSNDTFKKFNKVAGINIYFESGQKLCGLESHTLKDQKEFQSLKFAKAYEADRITFNTDGTSYRGSAYDDTCITEIELYHKGKKIIILNAEKLLNEYIKKTKTK